MATGKRDFDKAAANWDTAPRVKLAHEIARAMVRQMKLTSEMDVLDFGCGTGLVIFQLAGLVKSVTGIDTSAGMLDVFRAKAQQQDIANVRAVFFDAGNGGKLPGSYHAIVSSMTLHHIPDIGVMARQFFEALLPGGSLGLADLDEEGGKFHDSNEGVFHYGFSRETLKKIFLAAGFVNVSFALATKMEKTGADGVTRTFPIFILTADKAVAA